MEPERIIKQVQATGGQLSLIAGKLKGKDLNQSTRGLVKKHKAAIISHLQAVPVEPNLKTCPLCQSRDFIHGHKGGYFCTTCQPDARPGDLVKAGGNWR